jgi:phage terminase large subunit
VKRLSSSLVERELAKRSQPIAFNISNFLFDKQLAFVQDPASFKTAVCSRRSGKTIACAADLIDTALKNPGVVCLYITLSRKNAKKIIWKEMLAINRDYNLGGHADNTELSLTFPNHSVVYASGAKDSTEIEKFRGLALKKVYIDESQSFRSYIRDLIDEVIAPALMDHAGTLVLIGTPGPVPTGYFYECSVNSNDVWSNHAWTFFDNPFIASKSGQTHQSLLDRELKRRGIAIDDPSIQREWFGRWVLDTDSLLLKYNADKNHFIQMPTHKYTYIMGIDLGFVDADAIAILAYSDHEPTTYLVEEYVLDKCGITELVAEIKRLAEKYDVAKMLIDEGGLGKKIAEEIRRRHHIPVVQAEKQRKMENIAFLNDALRTGMFKAKSGSRFAQDTYLVEVDREKSTPDKIKVKDNYHSDIIDAVLYAFKESPAYAYQPAKVKPAYKTPAWYEEEVSAMEQAAIEHFEALEDASKGFSDEF